MKIKDYLHLYLGCDMQDPYGQVYKLTIDNFDTLSHWGKPLLRPLSDITIKEGLYYQNSISKLSGITQYEAERTRYLLSLGFDLFGLIDAGLAIPRLLNS